MTSTWKKNIRNSFKRVRKLRILIQSCIRFFLSFFKISWFFFHKRSNLHYFSCLYFLRNTESSKHPCFRNASHVSVRYNFTSWHGDISQLSELYSFYIWKILIFFFNQVVYCYFIYIIYDLMLFKLLSIWIAAIWYLIYYSLCCQNIYLKR